MNIFTTRRTSITCALLVLLVLLAADTAMGQTAARPDRGVMKGASYSVSDIENIGLTNGNVNLSIPLASLPPIAGGKLSFTLSAVYNSKLWDITRTEHQMDPYYGCPTWIEDTPQLSDRGGWRIFGGYSIQIRDGHEDVDYVIPSPPGGDTCETDSAENYRLQNNWYRVFLVTPDGAEHELRPTEGSQAYAGTRPYLWGYYKDTPHTLGTALRYYSLDGTYISAVINPSTASTYWTIYLKDGTRVTQLSNGIQRITDTNGNSIKIFTDTNGTHYQDEQTGREIRYGTDNKVYYQTVGGNWATININWGTTTVQGKIYRVNDWIESGGETGGGMHCTYDTVIQTDIPVIRDIIFPATEPSPAAPSKFSFKYNSDSAENTTASHTVRWACGMAPETYNRTVSKGMGSLSEMLTPAGATVKYKYTKDLKHSFSLFNDTNDIARETLDEKKVVHGINNEITDTWDYNIYESGACGGSVSGPDGSVVTEACYDKDPAQGQYNGVGDKAGLVYRSISNGQLVDRHWTSLGFAGAHTQATGAIATGSFNPVVDAEYLTLLDGNGNLLRTSAKTYQIDFNGNVIQTTEYDWFDPTLVYNPNSGVPNGVPTSATVLRVTNHSYYNPATTASSTNVYAKRSLSTGTPLILSAPQETTIGPAITQLSYDGQAYGTAPTAGNLTTQKVWDDLDSKWITSSQAYGSYGNLISRTDPRGKVTLFNYDDATHALPTSIVVDPQNGTGTQTTSTEYDYSTGLVTSQTDANNNVTTISYANQLLGGGASDPFGRPGITYGPTIASQRHRVTMFYKDSARQVIQASDLTTPDDQLLKTQTTRDRLGRVIKTEQTEDGTNYSISSQNVYEQMGKITYSSNPTRGSGATTNGWTRTTSDNAGRVIEVAMFSGDAQPSATSYTNSTGYVTTAYNAEFTTVTDQAGKVRRSKVDALDRLVRVDEPDGSNNLGSTTSPVQPTSYTYSVLGNLVTVTQGVQTRSFTYDSLSRLRTAVNPESGTITYSYDDNGNLTRRTDARGVYVDNVYDALNRATSRTYSDGTPTVTYTYDSAGVANSKGRLTSASSSVSTTNTTAFDAHGKIVSGNQITDGQTYSISYGYNLAGGLTSLTYPSGRVIETKYDSAGRVAGIKDQLSGTYYAGAIGTDATNRLQYSASGSVSVMKLGNGLWEHTNFNSRLQPTEIGLGTSATNSSTVGLIYNYGTTSNNGNLQSVAYAGGGLSYTQTFSYDSLNRLTTSVESGSSWSQTNSYDRYGNRSIVGGPLNFSATNNRITSSGYTYDAAGNLTNDGAQSFAFDAENKIKTVNGETDVYRYDASGNRVRKNFTTGEKVRMVYSGGQLLAEYDLSNNALKKEYVYGAKGLIVTIEPSSGTKYTTADHLGTPRVITSSTGAVISRHDYMPFGEEIGSGIGGRNNGMGFSVADGQRQKFTSKERDNETGLDYFLARYYSAIQGRFTSPDAPLADQFPQNPQSWNLYSYTRNNPLRVADKDGRITPWDILDIVSLAMSVRDFWKNPSWSNAGWVAADAIGAALPLVPLGSLRRANQLMKLVEGSASVRHLENATEVAAFSRLSREGMVLATGQDNVRQAVGMENGGPVADLLTLTPGNKFIISEVKEVQNLATGTADVGHALEQLSNTAAHLTKNVSGAEISKVELVIRQGTDLGPNYQKSGDQLLRLNSSTGKMEPVKIANKVVHVREISPPPKLPKYLK